MSDPTLHLTLQPITHCQHKDCQEVGYTYTHPGTNPPETVFYCANHAQAGGFCYSCGGFFGGMESFDFGDGLCDDCEVEMEDDHDYDPDEFGDGDDWAGYNDWSYEEGANHYEMEGED